MTNNATRFLELPKIESVLLWLAILSIVLGFIYYRHAYRFLFGSQKAQPNKTSQRVRKWISVVVTAVFSFCGIFILYFLAFYRVIIK